LAIFYNRTMVGRVSLAIKLQMENGMDLNEILQPGMYTEDAFQVTDERTAIHVGSGASRVLATPWMIAFMERVSHGMLAAKLPQGFSSVGVVVNVRHLAPTPVGDVVRVRAEIVSIDGWRVNFHVEAWDSKEKVGDGEHQRFVIDEQRFLKRAAAKREPGEG
jgi:fluoroacetyl-CoA thioesterase